MLGATRIHHLIIPSGKLVFVYQPARYCRNEVGALESPCLVVEAEWIHCATVHLRSKYSQPVHSHNALQLSGNSTLSEPTPQQLRATPLAVRAISDHRGLVEKDPSSVSPMSRTTAVPCTSLLGARRTD